MTNYKRVVLHIGLPKTGTTTLQLGFFPKYSAYAGKWERLDPDAAAEQNKTHPYFGTETGLFEIYYQFSGQLPPSGNNWRDDLSRWADKLDFDESGLLIISWEGLTEWYRSPSEVWPVDYDSPEASGTHPITIFLSELRLLLSQEINLTTILTLRNQSDFLGSLAAELGTMRYFESNSFDRLATHGDVFLDYNQLVRDLENVSGAQNHLTLLFEDGLETNMSKIIDLIGQPDLDANFDPLREVPRENRRRSGTNSWVSKKERLPIHEKIMSLATARTLQRSKLGALFRPLSRLLYQIQKALLRGPGTVEISDADRLRIRAICRTSNELLAAHLKRNLIDLGY